MGGSLNVAIRFKDGTAVCVERWTNNTPAWFKHPKMFRGDEEYVREYLAMTRNNDYIMDPGMLGKPQPLENSSYGLIVFDYLTNSILDNNEYCNVVNFDPIYAGGPRVTPEWLECAKDGRIYMIVRKLHRRKVVEITRTGLLSPELALQTGEEEWAKEWGPGARPARETTWNTFGVDVSPMVYYPMPPKSNDHYDDNTGNYSLHPDFTAKLLELGFPMTPEQGLNATLPPVPTAEGVSVVERKAREIFYNWKVQTRVPDADESDWRPYDGVAFDAIPQELRERFIKRATEQLERKERVRI